MRKGYLLAVVLMTGVLGSLSLVSAAEKAAGSHLKGIKCMLCKMQVSKDHAVDYKGGKVFFGCAACPSTFKKNTAKYAAKANAQLVATKQARQKACPLMGKPVKKSLTQKVGGVEVAFCCPGCKKKLAKLTADEQIEKVFGSKAFGKGFEVAQHAH